MESAFLFNNGSIAQCPIENRSIMNILNLPIIIANLPRSQINHYYFQIANVCFCLAFLATNSIIGILYLRFILIIGCSFLLLWNWYIQCYLDAILWNIIFIAINCIYTFTLIIRLRPIYFTHEIEEVYKRMFKPLKVTRHQFKKIATCMDSIRTFQVHEIYVKEKVDKISTLSLVISGKFVVSQNGRLLHIVLPYEFIDSAEWFSNVTNDFFQVSITSIVDSKMVIWHRDKLKLSMMSDTFLQSIFDHIIGRDVVNKLIQVSEAMIINFQDKNDKLKNKEDNVFIANKKNENFNINLLLNRQSQDEHVPLLCSTVNNT